MIELMTPKEFVGKNLTELSLRSKYSVNVVAIRKRNSAEIEKNTGKVYTTDCVPHPVTAFWGRGERKVPQTVATRVALF